MVHADNKLISKSNIVYLLPHQFPIDMSVLMLYTCLWDIFKILKMSHKQLGQFVSIGNVFVT